LTSFGKITGKNAVASFIGSQSSKIVIDNHLLATTALYRNI